jgi:hypothetical protein
MSKNIERIELKKHFPKPTEERDKQKGFMKWGKKNDYPFYLIDLLYGSAWHQGIIKNKTYYIAGSGLQYDASAEMQRFIANAFTDFDMNEVAQKLCFDFELFGGMIVKGTWNREGSRVASWEHIPVDSGRLSPDEMTLYISDDWSALKQTPEETNYRTLPALNEENKRGSFFIYYKEPAKQAKGEKGIYPKPPYYGGVNAIDTDMNISKWHAAEIANSFKAGTLISLNSGHPETEEEARKIKDQIKGPTQSIEDAGEIVIVFSDGQDQAPTVLPLSGNNLADRYKMTEESVQQNILVAHSVTVPTAFGIIQQGSFNAAESGDLFEIFKKTYVNARQKQIEWLIKEMAKLSGAFGDITLKDVPFISQSVQETPEAVVPGAAPVDVNTVPDVDVAKSALNGAQIASLVEVVANIQSGVLTPDSALQIVLASFPSIDETQARKIVGLPAVTFSSCAKDHEFSADEIDVFSEYGSSKSDYKVLRTIPIEWDSEPEMVFHNEDQMFASIGEIKAGLSEVEKNILTLLSDGQDAPSIAKALNTTIEVVAKTISKMITLEVYAEGEVTELGKSLLKEVQAPINRFEVRYSYQERADVPEVKTQSRDFCKRLIGLNRLYTREEIEQISRRIRRDVWKYRGGWYTNPDTGVSTPYCRHIWNQQLVIKRS